MIQRLDFLHPEIILFIATCVVMVMGLSRTLAARKATAWVAGLGIIAAGVSAYLSTPHGLAGARAVHPSSGQVLLPNLAVFAKCMIAAVGLMLLFVMAGTVDRRDEEAIAAGRARFDPLRANRAEFYAFFLFSLTGLMLCAGADDLIWLFLALELTSLPTYIMVTISSGSSRSREAGVKYFFLGALGAAIFLYGFALIYGGTGSTNLNTIHQTISTQGLSGVTLAGLMLALMGLCFKIAAVPMHFYTADVYEGAAAPVSAFLAFVPKAAGFLSILLLCAVVGWSGHEGSHGLPQEIRVLLWVVAALTMTVGNVLAILQKSVKRVLAYSSIAHSGYMLVGVIAGPGDGSFSRSGVSAVLFYLLAYGVMNLGTFAVIAALERSPGRDGEPREIEGFDDLRGLCAKSPLLGWTMVICSMSLLGFPPLLGFFGKLPLFTAGVGAGEIVLVIVLGLNSAIAAYYYLRLMAAPLLESGSPADLGESPFVGRRFAAALSAAGVIVLAFGAGRVMDASEYAGRSGIHGVGERPPLVRAPEAAQSTPDRH
jgi:NADH-quinone oxidoreductase subunit N